MRPSHRSADVPASPETDDSLRVLRNLHEMMRVVSQATDTNDTLQRIAEGVRTVVGFEVAAISRLGDDDVFTLVALSGDESARETLLGRRTPRSRIQAEFDVADKWGMLRFVPEGRLADAAESGWVPNLTPLDDEDAWRPEDTLFAPLYSPTEKLLGLMSVDMPANGKRPDQYTREILEMYAAQAGVALDNARQRELWQEELRLARATREVVRLASEETDPEGILDVVAKPLAEGLGARWLLGKVSAEAVNRDQPIVASWPRDEVVEHFTSAPSIFGAIPPAAQRAWELDRVAFLNAHERVDDPAFEGVDVTDLMREMRHWGYTKLMLVPVGSRTTNQRLGAFAALRHEDDPLWSSEEADAAAEIGRELGLALQQCLVAQRDRQLVEELRALDEYKRQMIATITHELKNPLTSIYGHVEVLEDAGAPAQAVSAIQRNAERLTTLVANMLTLARLEGTHTDFQGQPVDLGKVVHDVRELLDVQAQAKQVDVTIDQPAHSVVVRGEAEELDRLVTNLLSNAIKFSRDGGRVRIALSTLADTVTLIVEDEGIGISPEDQAKLFHEFHRASDPEAKSVPGTGLGLAIAKRIVERHGGTIGVASSRGRGSTFTIRLPRHLTVVA